MTTCRSDLYHLLATCHVYVKVIIKFPASVRFLLYFLKLSCKTTNIHTCTFFFARASKTFSWLIFVLSCLFRFVTVLLWFQFSLTYLNSIHTFIVHIGALLVLFLHAVVNIKIIYGAQYKMYSCWYSYVCSPNSGCLLGPYCFLSTLFWNSLWGFDVLLTMHLSIFILVINQLDAQNLFTISLFHASTCFEHRVLIVRRSKLYYTVSGFFIS